jgi:hypothetical protein
VAFFAFGEQRSHLVQGAHTPTIAAKARPRLRFTLRFARKSAMAVDSAGPGCFISATTANADAGVPRPGASACEMHSRGATVTGENGALEELEDFRSPAPNAPPGQNS